MSIGLVSGLAASPLSQRAAEADKAQQALAEQARAVDAGERAELAAGIGQTEEDSEAADRDADGRRLWERAAEKRKQEQSVPGESQPAPVLAKDPTGDCGGALDLIG